MELYAAAKDEIPLLLCRDTYRRLYFVRRVMTTLEIKGGLQRLDQCPEFKQIQVHVLVYHFGLIS
jgi:hypothetical protein